MKDLRNAAYEIRQYLIDLALSGSITESDFYQITSLLSPQSRSPLWEKYFISKYDCAKVNKNEKRGDVHKSGRFYEFKASGFNQDDGLHIVQIRLWHDCDYIIQSISSAGAISLCYLMQRWKMRLFCYLLNQHIPTSTVSDF